MMFKSDNQQIKISDNKIFRWYLTIIGGNPVVVPYSHGHSHTILEYHRYKKGPAEAEP